MIYLGYFGYLVKKWRPRHAVGRMILLVFLLGVDSVNGSMQILNGGSDRLRLPVNFASSSIWNLYRMQQESAHGLASEALPPIPSTVHDALRSWHAIHSDRSMMLLLVESMGQPRSIAVRDWLAKQAEAPGLEDRWTVRAGHEGFLRSTTQGELRVLFGLEGRYERIDEWLAPRRLPAQLAR